MKLVKLMVVLGVLASGLSLGACAHRNDSMSTTSTTASSTRGYSK